jgi:hypothetical protein
MAAFAPKQWRNPNGIERFAPSARMRRLVGEPIRRADVDPPPRFANPRSGFILMDHIGLDQSRFEAAFHLGQLLMAAFHKAGDAARRELDSQHLLQQLAGPSVGNRLTFYQRGRQGLDASAILRRSRNAYREGRPCEMKALGALFFFHPMLSDPKPFGRQVDHLASLWDIRWTGTQIRLAALTPLDRMKKHLIGDLHLPQVMATMAALPTRLLAALLPPLL